MDTNQIKEKSLEVIKQANEFKIATQEHFSLAGEFLKKLKTVQKQIADTFDPIITKARSALNEAREQKDKHLNPILEAETLVKKKMLIFKSEEDKKRREYEEKLAEEARQKELKEKQRLEKQALKAEAKGDTERAEELREKKEEVFVPAPIIPEAEKTEGISTKIIWKARIIDESLVPREYMLVDLIKLSKLARAVHNTMKIPGVEFYSEECMAVGIK